jgi:hypothetical protein
LIAVLNWCVGLRAVSSIGGTRITRSERVGEPYLRQHLAQHLTIEIAAEPGVAGLDVASAVDCRQIEQ